MTEIERLYEKLQIKKTDLCNKVGLSYYVVNKYLSGEHDDRNKNYDVILTALKSYEAMDEGTVHECSHALLNPVIDDSTKFFRSGKRPLQTRGCILCIVWDKTWYTCTGGIKAMRVSIESGTTGYIKRDNGCHHDYPA